MTFSKVSLFSRAILALAAIAFAGGSVFAQPPTTAKVYDNGIATAVSVAGQAPTANNCVMVSNTGSKNLMVPNGTQRELDTFACRAGGGSSYCQNARNAAPSTIAGVTLSSCDCSVPQSETWGSTSPQCQGTIPAGTTNTPGSSSGPISSIEAGTTGSASFVCTDTGSGAVWVPQTGSSCTQGCTNPTGTLGQVIGPTTTTLLTCNASGSIYKTTTQTCTSTGWVSTTKGGSNCVQSFDLSTSFSCSGCPCDGKAGDPSAGASAAHLCTYLQSTITDSQGQQHPVVAGQYAGFGGIGRDNSGGVYMGGCDTHCDSCKTQMTYYSCYYNY